MAVRDVLWHFPSLFVERLVATVDTHGPGAPVKEVLPKARAFDKDLEQSSTIFQAEVGVFAAALAELQLPERSGFSVLPHQLEIAPRTALDTLLEEALSERNGSRFTRNNLEFATVGDLFWLLSQTPQNTSGFAPSEWFLAPLHNRYGRRRLREAEEVRAKEAKQDPQPTIKLFQFRRPGLKTERDVWCVEPWIYGVTGYSTNSETGFVPTLLLSYSRS